MSQGGPEAEFWAGVRQHQLLIKACPRCGVRLHPRRTVCPVCGHERLDWLAASGRGNVYSLTTLHRAPSTEMEAALPYQLGIVRLVEDVFFFTRLFGNGPEALSVGAPVELRFRVLELGMELPVFVEA